MKKRLLLVTALILLLSFCLQGCSALADAFKALDCKGVARIDFLYDKAADELYIGEINTIPGSLAFYLWEGRGISFERMIDMMVEYAFRANADRNENVFSYHSAILSGSSGAKGAKR